MATMTFDKLTYVDGLKAAGISDAQARAMAEGLDKALRDEIVTKPELRLQLAEFKHDILRWLIASQFVLAGFIFGILKYLGH